MTREPVSASRRLDGGARDRWDGAVESCVLAVLSVAVYARVRGYPFIHFDDPHYVTGNAVVRKGLTLEGLRWAFTSTEVANWHPLTWLSHMVDVE
ncbi:MAG TPA: hypothetical protein VF847_05270, partial [Candidatus Deferrimicrobiaceae bacterium]